MNKFDERYDSAFSFQAALSSLSKYVLFCVKRWYILLLFGLLGGLFGIFRAWLSPNKFKAEHTFTIEEESKFSGGLLGIASTVGIDLGGRSGTFSVENVIEFIKSRTMLEKALLQNKRGFQDVSLLKYYIDSVFQLKNNTASYAPSKDRSTYTRYEDSLLKACIKTITMFHLNVGKPDKRLAIVSLSCISPKEEFSKELVDNLIDEVSKFYIETRTRKNVHNVGLLQAKADSLNRAISGNISYRAASTDANINAALQAPTVGAQKSQYNISVLTAAYSEVLKNLEMAKINLQRDLPLIQSIDTPIYPLENLKKGRLYGAIVFGIIGGLLGIFYLYILFSIQAAKLVRSNN